jgi:hypothetical protein
MALYSRSPFDLEPNSNCPDLAHKKVFVSEMEVTPYPAEGLPTINN